MGKKRIKAIDLAQKGKVKKKKPRKVVKTGKEHGRLSDMGAVTLAETEEIKKKKKEEEKELEKKVKTEVKKKTKSKKKTKLRSKRYQALKIKFDRNKFYPSEEAIELLINLANSKIDETVEIHLSTQVDKLTGRVNLPHGTGKKQIVAIADDKLIDKVSKGKIDFDVLIASPKMMPKIAQIAKILGPRGLMPNPKADTISEKPAELKKQLEKGEIRFKTETKAPLLHLTIGKISFGKEKLGQNLEALIKAVAGKNIKKATLTSTHSPGVKLDLTNI